MRNALRNGFAAAGVLMAIFLVSSASAQTAGMHGNGIAQRGVPASVTSFGFGGHPGFHGVPASVTSQSFGVSNNFRGLPGHVTSFGFGARNGFHQRPFEHGRHHIRRSFVVYSPYYGGYAYAPYAYPYDYDVEDYNDSADSQAPPADSRDDYRNNDDRQVLDQDYRAELNRPTEQSSTSERSPEPVVAQPSTLLIFKDGHQQEVSNYAIVGGTLYDLSDGRSKKVQLTDLDLSATVKQNDERGVEFQVPQAQLN
jgi:hypothetical protein